MRLLTPTVRTGAVIGLVAALLMLSACAKTQRVNGNGGLNGGGPVTSPTAPIPGSAGAPVPATSTTTAATQKTPTKPAKPAGPTIDSFVVSQRPACPVNNGTDAPYSTQGTDIKLKWKVSGATQAALSLDDPNFFKTYHTGSIQNYPAVYEVDLPFNCDPKVQPNTTHVYSLDIVGASPSLQKSLTVTVQTSP